VQTEGLSKAKDSAGRIAIESAPDLRKLLAEYYLDLHEAQKDPKRKIAWVSSVGPVELLRAYGFEVYFPENHGALLGATRNSARYIPKAVAQGYSPDICSYLTADIGAHLSGKSPLQDAYGIEGVPRPDVLVYSTNQCRDVGDWWAYYAREYKVPLLGIHPPHLLDEIEDRHLQMVHGEHERVSQELQKISGRSLDQGYLKEIVELSRQASILWREILNLASNRPSPHTFFDAVIHMAPIVVLRGKQETIDYYNLLKAEMMARVEKKVGAVPKERLRIYWEGMPIWGALRELSTLFFDLNTAVVASTYCNTWAFDKLDPANIDESMARVYTELFINRTDSIKMEILRKLVDDFTIDGVVFHDCKTCPNNSNCRYGMPDRLLDEYGVANVTIGADVSDLRLYSPDQVRTTLEGFIEQLSES
jgi:benzoyl-CoA reductase/2-hydroxyglutaryl-CoA dehydratase subunit BcrC/BadD/HgdB